MQISAGWSQTACRSKRYNSGSWRERDTNKLEVSFFFLLSCFALFRECLSKSRAKDSQIMEMRLINGELHLQICLVPVCAGLARRETAFVIRDRWKIRWLRNQTHVVHYSIPFQQLSFRGDDWVCTNDQNYSHAVSCYDFWFVCCCSHTRWCHFYVTSRESRASWKLR